MSKRPPGLGSITPTKNGFWARGPRQPDNSRPSFGVHPTYELAEEALLAAIHVQRAGLRRETTQPFATFAATILDEREKNGVRGCAAERRCYVSHLATAHFATMAIDRITSADVARWLRDMSVKKARRGIGKGKSIELARTLSRRTIVRALTVLSAIFQAAGPNDRNIIERNPCDGMKVKRRAGKEATKDVEVFLTLEEQFAIRECRAIPDPERYFVLFAFGCGVRRGEQYNLELRDVDVENEEVTVRFGADGLPPKNGEVETIPLFGYALEAARWQIAHLETQPNPLGLLWPTKNGHRRKGKPLGGHFRPAEKGTHKIVKGKPRRVKAGTGTHVYVDRFRELLRLAGITRPVRWHDLRHTCASALLQGQWGQAWTLAEVKGQLRHSSVTVTERYAHLGETALKNAAKKVLGYGRVTGPEGARSRRAEVPGIVQSRESGLNRRPALYESGAMVEMLRALTSENAPGNPLVSHLAEALAAALSSEMINRRGES